MKKNLADSIEQYLKVLIDRSEENQIEIQRAELAETFCCVPSQVTYVLSTRFTENEGYLTHSRRGGKGFVRITRFTSKNDPSFIHCTKSLFEYIDKQMEHNLIGLKEADLIKYVVMHNLKYVPPEYRNTMAEGLIEALKEYFRSV